MNEPGGATLKDLGWTPAFQQQLSLEELETLVPARVFEVQRSGLTLRAEAGEVTAPLGGRWFQGAPLRTLRHGVADVDEQDSEVQTQRSAHRRIGTIERKAS